jgi:hypothetical protein
MCFRYYSWILPQQLGLVVQLFPKKKRKKDASTEDSQPLNIPQPIIGDACWYY